MTDSRQGIPFTKTSVFSSKTPLTGLLPLTNNRQARHTPRIVVYTRKLILKTSLTGQSIHMFLTRHSSLVRRPTSTRRVRSSGVLDAACPLPERIGILFDDPLTPCLPPVSSTHYRIFAPAAKIANRHASSTAVCIRFVVLPLLDRRCLLAFFVPPPPTFPAVESKPTGSTAGPRRSACLVSGNAAYVW